MNINRALRALSVSVFATLASLSLASPGFAEVKKPAGHAHNDYEHDRPLLDAIDHGFASIEADIWLHDGQLLVGHDEADLDPARTLESLYLDPLRDWAAGRAAGGPGETEPLTLLIDIKTEGEATYETLAAVLVDYADLLSVVEDGRRVEGAVAVVISGNRPKATMLAEDERYAFYDGRLADLDGGLSTEFMPLVSDNWARHFTWAGAGEMPGVERERLNDVVAKAHAAGFRLRFWGTPDIAGPERDALWRTLAEAGVDLINTDDLAGFRDFKF